MRKLIVPLLIAFTVAAGCESRADKDAKPAVITVLVETSQNKYDTGPKNPEKYNRRLAAVLKKVNTRDLKLLKSLNIDIALDQSLSQQNTGVWDRMCLGVFVPTHANAGVLKLWDNGSTESSLLGTDTYDYGATVAEQLADYIRSNGGKLPTETLFATRYSCGNSCGVIKIKNAEDFDKDTQKKNPELAKLRYKHQPKR
jgi:hypothetical protein